MNSALVKIVQQAGSGQKRPALPAWAPPSLVQPEHERFHDGGCQPRRCRPVQSFLSLSERPCASAAQGRVCPAFRPAVWWKSWCRSRSIQDKIDRINAKLLELIDTQLAAARSQLGKRRGTDHRRTQGIRKAAEKLWQHGVQLGHEPDEHRGGCHQWKRCARERRLFWKV